MCSTTTSDSRDDLRRSVRLFRSFLTEQADPEGFYSLIADDAVALIEKHEPLSGRRVVDFGGGPGFYTRAFRDAGARCILVDADMAELSSRGAVDPAAVVARAEQAPLADGAADIVFSSNLLEHVPNLAIVADQMARVVRPGGLLVLSYTVWLGPWGGHETSPWHYLGGHRAARRYQRKHGKPPKNVYGSSMFAASAKAGVKWARQRHDFELVEARPRYLPPWSSALLWVPGVREVVTWNLWLVLRKR